MSVSASTRKCVRVCVCVFAESVFVRVRASK